MNKYIILSTLLLTIMTCSIKEKPEFLRIENIEVEGTKTGFITLSADAYFKNPNAVGGQLRTEEIKVFINSNEMATISAKAFEVPAKAEFSIPIKANIPTDSLLNPKNLNGLLGSLLSQKLNVRYKGTIKYKVFGFSHKYSIDKNEDIKLKL